MYATAEVVDMSLTSDFIWVRRLEVSLCHSFNGAFDLVDQVSRTRSSAIKQSGGWWILFLISSSKQLFFQQQ